MYAENLQASASASSTSMGVGTYALEDLPGVASLTQHPSSGLKRPPSDADRRFGNRPTCFDSIPLITLAPS